MNEIGVIASIVSAAVGAVLGVVGAKRNLLADGDRHSRESATIISEIGYIKSGIDDIKRKQEKTEERYYDLAVRVSRLETAVWHKKEE